MIFPALRVHMIPEEPGFQEIVINLKTVLLAAAFLAGSPVFAQAPASGAPPQKPPAHQPGVPAHPGSGSTTTTQDSLAPAEKVDPAKEAAIRHLMDLTQTSKMGEDLNAYVTKQVHDAPIQA